MSGTPAVLCGTCRSPVDLQLHEFFEGLCHQSRPANYRPVREWSYVAALYHNPVTRESYCSPQCATAAVSAFGTSTAPAVRSIRRATKSATPTPKDSP